MIEKRVYDPDGNLVRLEVENLANVFIIRDGTHNNQTKKVPVGLDDDDNPLWETRVMPAPGAKMAVQSIDLSQVTTFEYRLGRLYQTTLPDGLKRSILYDKASYPKKITWLKTNKPIDHHFTRDDSGRVLEIKNTERKTLQEFDYDRYGNIKVNRFRK